MTTVPLLYLRGLLFNTKGIVGFVFLTSIKVYLHILGARNLHWRSAIGWEEGRDEVLGLTNELGVAVSRPLSFPWIGGRRVHSGAFVGDWYRT